MKAGRHRSPRPARPMRVPVLLVALILALAAAFSLGSSTEKSAPLPSGSSPPPRESSVGISAVGDVIMGSTPALPPDGGRHLFDGVADRLAGDVVLANLDQALTDQAASTKCGSDSSSCYAFRTPPSYARWLREAGFTVINLANNHSHDFGDAGLRDTQAALTAHNEPFPVTAPLAS